jgi:hypothetical protein
VRPSPSFSPPHPRTTNPQSLLRKSKKSQAKFSLQKRHSWRPFALTLLSIVPMPTWSTCSLPMTSEISSKITLGASHTTRQSRPHSVCVPTLMCLVLRYRTPLCVLYPPKIIATACYILSQRIADGPHSLSLDARVSPSAPSASLPTPPTHKPASPDESRFAIEFFGLNESELLCVAGMYHGALVYPTMKI